MSERATCNDGSWTDTKQSRVSTATAPFFYFRAAGRDHGPTSLSGGSSLPVAFRVFRDETPLMRSRSGNRRATGGASRLGLAMESPALLPEIRSAGVAGESQRCVDGMNTLLYKVSLHRQTVHSISHSITCAPPPPLFPFCCTKGSCRSGVLPVWTNSASFATPPLAAIPYNRHFCSLGLGVMKLTMRHALNPKSHGTFHNRLYYY